MYVFLYAGGFRLKVQKHRSLTNRRFWRASPEDGSGSDFNRESASKGPGADSSYRGGVPPPPPVVELVCIPAGNKKEISTPGCIFKLFGATVDHRKLRSRAGGSSICRVGGDQNCVFFACLVPEPSCILRLCSFCCLSYTFRARFGSQVWQLGSLIFLPVAFERSHCALRWAKGAPRPLPDLKQC